MQAEQLTGEKVFSVLNPATEVCLKEVKATTLAELEDLVAKATQAAKEWAGKTVKDRAVFMYKYRDLLLAHKEELVALIHAENGKLPSEAQAEWEKSLELTEFACSMPQLMQGELLEVSKGVECKTVLAPLGVVACITPFNFPLMVPHWTIPNAIMAGNAVILKPSEKTPLSAIRMQELFLEAGFPAHLLTLAHGDKDMVNALCDHEGIKALSFVGSTPVAKIVYRRAAAAHKRVLCLGGAKNHLIVLPDAHPDMTATNVVASMSGCAGQRCMAASVMVAVGDCDHIIAKMRMEAERLKACSGIGPVISKMSQQRIFDYITEAEKGGAKVLVDGRDVSDVGFFVGPTIVDFVSPTDAIAQEELFGPVIAIIRVKTIEEALTIENNCPFGNAASVFTQNGALASHIMANVSAGMCGVNVGVPVPREPFAFGGWNDSRFGAGDLTGKGGIAFFTQTKKITTKWNPESKVNWMS